LSFPACRDDTTYGSPRSAPRPSPPSSCSFEFFRSRFRHLFFLLRFFTEAFGVYPSRTGSPAHSDMLFFCLFFCGSYAALFRLSPLLLRSPFVQAFLVRRGHLPLLTVFILCSFLSAPSRAFPGCRASLLNLCLFIATSVAFPPL